MTSVFSKELVPSTPKGSVRRVSLGLIEKGETDWIEFTGAPLGPVNVMCGLLNGPAEPLAVNKVQALSAQYAATKGRLETAEEEWLRLEMLKEEMEER